MRSLSLRAAVATRMRLWDQIRRALRGPRQTQNLDLRPARCLLTGRFVAVLRGMVTPGRSPQSRTAQTHRVLDPTVRFELSQPWGQRNAYEPQKGIEVDALGALNASPISAVS